MTRPQSNNFGADHQLAPRGNVEEHLGGRIDQLTWCVNKIIVNDSESDTPFGKSEKGLDIIPLGISIKMTVLTYKSL
jgi:hypothetical protein